MTQAAATRRPFATRRATEKRRLSLPKAPLQPLELESDALFQGAREVHIRHNDSIYRLSITRFEKLLLTK